MAIPSKAPRKMGPQLSGPATTPTATVQADGSVAVGWPANWDRDDLRLTYRLSRNGTVIDTVSTSDPFWKLTEQTYLDTDPGAEGGTTASYTVAVSDPDGNTITSPAVTVELPAPAPSATPTEDPNQPATGMRAAARSGTTEAGGSSSASPDASTVPPSEQPGSSTTTSTDSTANSTPAGSDAATAGSDADTASSAGTTNP
jgi:hypothetical protein